MDNVISNMNTGSEVLLVERVSKKIMLNGKTFVIEEPSRRRLMDYMNLQKDIAVEVIRDARPLQELREKFEDAEPDKIDELTVELQEKAQALSEAHVDSDNRILKFILGETATDEFLDGLGIQQKQKIVEIAEEIYGITDLIKKGKLYFPTRGDVIGL